MKLSAKEVVTGMICEVISQDKDLEFGFDPDASMMAPGVVVPIGTHIEVMKAPYKVQGSQRVDFRIVGDTKVSASFWSIFRNNTELLSGTPAIVTPISVTSTGRFAGFDLKVSKVELEDYISGLGFSQLKVYFEFVGSLTGAKKVNTKLINQIKASPGFKTEILAQIDHVLASRRSEIDAFIVRIDPSARYFKHAYDNRIVTWYSGGKLSLESNIMDDFTTLRSDIEKQVDVFIASKSTNTRFLGK
jgi:hypothetical protein